MNAQYSKHSLLISGVQRTTFGYMFTTVLAVSFYGNLQKYNAITLNWMSNQIKIGLNSVIT